MNVRQLTFSAIAFVFTFASTLFINSVAIADDYHVGDVYINHPYARASVPGQISGAAYLTLENKGDRADTLISVQSPAVKAVEIHTMSMTDNVMRMREVTHIELKPKEKLSMLPGSSYHIMLIGLTAPLKVGDKFPLILSFKKAGKIETSIVVEDDHANK
jgi:copper(I)-binding protein